MMHKKANAGQSCETLVDITERLTFAKAAGEFYDPNIP